MADKPAESLLLKAIHYKDDNNKMPPKVKMPDKDIATLEKWVKDGLPVSADPRGRRHREEGAGRCHGRGEEVLGVPAGGSGLPFSR